MSAARTPWFDSATKPKRAGVYETRIPNIASRKTYQRWDGGTWGCYAWTPEHAGLSGNKHLKGTYQHVQWRGLASDPSKVAK